MLNTQGQNELDPKLRGLVPQQRAHTRRKRDQTDNSDLGTKDLAGWCTLIDTIHSGNLMSIAKSMHAQDRNSSKDEGSRPPEKIDLEASSCQYEIESPKESAANKYQIYIRSILRLMIQG